MLEQLPKWLWKLREARKIGDLPNKCDMCGLMVAYPAANHATTHDLVNIVGKLEKYGLAKRPRRTIDASVGRAQKPDMIYFCALGHTVCWKKKHMFCPDWQLKIPNDEIKLSDYLTIHHTRTNTRIAIGLGIVAIVLTIWPKLRIG